MVGVNTYTVKTKVVISHRRCENCLTFHTENVKSEAILTPSVWYDHFSFYSVCSHTSNQKHTGRTEHDAIPSSVGLVASAISWHRSHEEIVFDPEPTHIVWYTNTVLLLSHTCSLPSNVRGIVTHFDGVVPLVVTAVISESSSSLDLLSLSFFTIVILQQHIIAAS